MGNIRKQSLIISLVTYLGFGLGLINVMLLFPNFFTKQEFGLTRIFLDLSQTVVAFCLSGTAVLYRFYPYYESYLPKAKRDIFAWVLISALLLFVPVMLGVYGLYVLNTKNQLMQTYGALLPLLSLGLLVYMVFESYYFVLQRSTLPGILRELGLRLYQLVLMLLFIAGWFTYAHFVVGFVLSYLLIALILWLGLWRMGYWPFTFKVSRLTQRLRKPMMQFAILGYAWYLFSLLSQTIDGIIITKVCGLQFTAIFSIADYASRLMLVPQRSISAASIGGLGRAWKERDMAKIQEVYSKSALLQLLAGLFIFLNIWLNIDEALSFLPSGYEAAKYAIFWLCLAKLMELSAGCSNELLSTSPHWRLNLYAYVVLFVASIPLNIFLVMRYGILGSAIAGSIAYFLFNTARVWLVWYKAKLQPFSLKTIWLLLLALGSFALTLLLPSLGYRILDMALRSSLFSLLFLVGIYGLEISPDVNFLFNKFFGRFLGPFKRPR